MSVTFMQVLACLCLFILVSQTSFALALELGHKKENHIFCTKDNFALLQLL